MTSSIDTASARVPGDRPAGNPRATRSVAMARNGMIATSQALASAAGLAVLRDGGNAIDAAVAAAGVLAVVEPTMNGVGGDLFAIVYDAATARLYGLDSSGRAPAAATPAAFAARGLDLMPASGPLTVTVPGTVAGWCALLDRFGTRSLARTLEPAIACADDGFPLQEILAADWRQSAARLAQDPDAAATFLPHGDAPGMGDVFRNPGLARTLQAIARDGNDGFYRGPLAATLAAAVSARGGLLTADDLAAHRAEWVDTISTSYRGYHLHELPPSTQGFVALEMLNILEGFDVATLGHNSAALLHLLVEAKKIAFADRGAHLADRAFVAEGVLERLISKDYAAARRAEIDPQRAGHYRPGALGRGTPVSFAGRDHGDTVYLTAADRHGNVISLIQSLFASFGSGIVAGDSGIVLHNRGAGFTLQPQHPNQIGPHKRPLHTLVPAMVLTHGRPWASFGVMGGDNQAQAHVQVMLNLVDFGMHIQEAGEAARVRSGDPELWIESGVGHDVRRALDAMGHDTRDGRGMMGGFQGIRLEAEVLAGGSDPRKDGLAIGW